MPGLTPGARLAASSADAAATIALPTAGRAGSVPDTAAITRVGGIGLITFASGKVWTAESASNGWISPVSQRLVSLSHFLRQRRATWREL